MSIEFRPSTPDQIAPITALFRESFPLTTDSTPMDPPMMAWKYFDRHPFWVGPRSFVVQQDGDVVAHVGLAPVRFAAANGLVESIQFLDWMASPRSPGSGLVAYWESLQVVETVLAVGGSDDARRLLPKLGWLRRTTEMQMYARPLHVSGRPAGVKSLLKGMRNLWWSIAPPLPSAGSWRCRPAPFLETVWMPRGDFIPIARTADWLNFHLKCPAVQFQAILLETNGRPAGHALLAYAGPQVRIADLVIDTMDEEQWTQACSSLVRMTAALPGCYEIAAASSLPFLQRVYRRCGFRYRGSALAFLGDPKHRFAPDALLELSLLTGDSSYLVDKEFQVWC